MNTAPNLDPVPPIGPGFSASPDQPRWEALLRGQIVSATIAKFFNYVNLADQKAQTMIVLNTVMIPVALNWIDKPDYNVGAAVSIVTAIISIMSAIICIYPKRRGGRKPDGTINLLHFGDIGRLKEAEFLAEFLPIYNEPARLAEAAIKDIHDVARRIIRPKFYWLKLSYIVFFFGNLLAIATTFYCVFTP